MTYVIPEDAKVYCKVCGWTGLRKECGFGHNDFFCPECGMESIRETEKLEFKEELCPICKVRKFTYVVGGYKPSTCNDIECMKKFLHPEIAR